MFVHDLYEMYKKDQGFVNSEAIPNIFPKSVAHIDVCTKLILN